MAITLHTLAEKLHELGATLEAILAQAEPLEEARHARYVELASCVGGHIDQASTDELNDSTGWAAYWRAADAMIERLATIGQWSAETSVEAMGEAA